MEKGPYHELGEDFFDHLHEDRLTRYLVRHLEKLGQRVRLEPLAA